MSLGQALYLIASARRMSRQGVGCPSIDPRATDEELKRELEGGEPAPSWTPPPLPDLPLPDLSTAFGGAPSARVPIGTAEGQDDDDGA